MTRSSSSTTGSLSQVCALECPSPDATWTALIIESYERLGAHLAALPPHWRERAAGFRDWARDHPFEFSILAVDVGLPPFDGATWVANRVATDLRPFLADNTDYQVDPDRDILLCDTDAGATLVVKPGR